MDHNEPLKGNIPSIGSSVTDGGLYDQKVWLDGGIDPRKAENHHRSDMKLPSVRPFIVANIIILGYFLILFPMDYIKGTMIPVMNQPLYEGDPHVSEHELTNWLGMRFVMNATKETAVGKIGGQRTIFELGAYPPSTSIRTWAV